MSLSGEGGVEVARKERARKTLGKKKEKKEEFTLND